MIGELGLQGVLETREDPGQKRGQLSMLDHAVLKLLYGGASHLIALGQLASEA